ncbi:MAG TPA: hypothetical protein ENH10_10915 [Bacteroidetes bacterium]|nr:hypothetical protein [Bacteroidota bacterium]HEX05642.1 hypothetical protein [Bacteroidota bacterium]
MNCAISLQAEQPDNLAETGANDAWTLLSITCPSPDPRRWTSVLRSDAENSLRLCPEKSWPAISM